jgi:hypothetical protein
MPLELVNTIASIVTTIVIGATAIAAVAQLRHLRAGNQSAALLTIENLFDQPDNVSARDIVRYELSAALADPDFRTYLFESPSGKHLKEVPAEFVRLRRAAALVANRYEVLGTLVKNRVVAEEPFMDILGALVNLDWNLLEAFIAITRDGMRTDTIWDNFEYIAARSAILVERGLQSRYPKGTPRRTPRNPWASDAAAVTPPPSDGDGHVA